MADHLGEFEQLLLLALLRLDDNAHGVRIRQEIESCTGRLVTAGAVHTAMSRMERRGFVSSFEGDTVPARGGRRRRHYQLEEPGTQALQRAYSQVIEMSRGIAERLAPQFESGDGDA